MFPIVFFPRGFSPRKEKKAKKLEKEVLRRVFCSSEVGTQEKQVVRRFGGPWEVGFCMVWKKRIFSDRCIM